MARKGFIQFGITGDKRLDKRLRKMDRKVSGKAIRKGMKEAMQPVLFAAKRRVPVLTGRLKKSIRVAGYAGRNFAGAAVLTGTRKTLRIPANAKSFYPAYIEYGYGKVRARSFLRSSMADKKKEVLGNVVSEIKKALENP